MKYYSKPTGKQWMELFKVIKEVNTDMIQISKGKVQTAKKTVAYGPEGIGKSTLASQFPNPVFIDTEGSTKELDVARYPKPNTWQDIISYLEDALAEKKYGTVVIDTADWAEQLCIQAVCDDQRVKGIENIGYGKGYVFAAEKFQNALKLCDKLIDAGINVVFTAHAQMRKFEQPDEMGAYDRWEMKLSKKIAPLLKEWADMVLFCNYKTDVITDSKTNSKKAVGGKRVIYTSHHPCWDAKNRYSLPEQIDMSFEPIAHLFKDIQPEPDYRAELRKVMADMTPEQKAEIVKKYGLNPNTTNAEYKATILAIKGGN